MQDIIGVFPTAEEVKEHGCEQFSLYLFEEELRSIFRVIVRAAQDKQKEVGFGALSNDAIDFLIQKGYHVYASGKDRLLMVAWE